MLHRASHVREQKAMEGTLAVPACVFRWKLWSFGFTWLTLTCHQQPAWESRPGQHHLTPSINNHWNSSLQAIVYVVILVAICRERHVLQPSSYCWVARRTMAGYGLLPENTWSSDVNRAPSCSRSLWHLLSLLHSLHVLPPSHDLWGCLATHGPS